MESPFSPEEQAQQGHRRKGTWRGRNNAKRRAAKSGDSHAAHEVAKQHIRAAEKATDPKQSHAHLFKAISALKKCQ